MKYAAFIPLRGGSKSIPRKNVLPMAGRPLCMWTVEAAASARHIDHVFVATDSPEIRSVIESYGLPKVTVVDRSPETATDTASTESAMLEFAAARNFENIVLIQATSPLLRAEDLDRGIEQFEASSADSLVSVVAQKRFIWARDPETGIGVPKNYQPEKRPRRQDFAAYHVENGAFYVTRREGLLRTGSRLFGRIAAYEMPEETYHELDEPVDFAVIERFLEERRSPPGRSGKDATESLPKGQLELAERARRVKMVLSDVDGVLTDSGMYYSESGDELKKFNTRDGKGFELLRQAGLEVGIITAENTRLVERRATKLALGHLIQGSKDKVESLRQLLAKTGLSADQVAFIGDDLGDVGILGEVGLAACPADATAEARSRAHYVCRARGGEGAVRELAELILSLRAPS